MRRPLAALIALLVAGCTTDEDAGWVAFNAEDQALTVQVRDGEPSTDVATITLTSTTGAVEVGSASVDPDAGPVGTIHTVSVDVLEDYEEEVTRVTLESVGERGEQRHTLVRDSADLGLWVVEIQSLGAEGESREDELVVRLWRDAEDGETGDTAAEDTGEEE